MLNFQALRATSRKPEKLPKLLKSTKIEGGRELLGRRTPLGKSGARQRREREESPSAGESRERCELHARSQLIGDLKAVHLVIEAGATFVGKSQITPIRGAIKDVAVAQKGEPQEIGSPR